MRVAVCEWSIGAVSARSQAYQIYLAAKNRPVDGERLPYIRAGPAAQRPANRPLSPPAVYARLRPMVSEQDLLRQGKQTPGAAVARHPPETAGPLLVLQRSDCHSCRTRPLTTPCFCSDPSIFNDCRDCAHASRRSQGGTAWGRRVAACGRFKG